MAAKKSKQDVAAAKAKKQKKIVIGGSVLLVALLAFQVPRTMKMLESAPPARAEEPAVTTTTAAPAPAAGAPVTLAPPTLESGGAATPVASTAPNAGPYPNTDPAPQPKVGHLVAFGRFRSKDPFRAQLPAGGSAAASSTPSAAEAAQEAVDAASGATEETVGIVGGSTGSTGTTTPSVQAPVPTTAVLSVNDTEEPVTVAGQFPAADPMFVLVSLTKGSAKIAIAGGTYANGDPTITLKLGKPITLMNTADGTRYTLELVSVG